MKDKTSKGNFSKWLALAILAVVFTLSAAKVLYDENTYQSSDVQTIRICHWQLELGFRDALQKLSDAYEKLYKERTGKTVRIVQIPVPGSAYGQFLNTGLIGDMAPDIIEMGFAETASSPSYVVRFFEPLGDAVREPNQYNLDAKDAVMPWKDTFFDAMAGVYEPTLLDYYAVPFSAFTVRIYYNKNLYEKIAGTEKVPKTYEEFMSFYRKTREYDSKFGKNIFPMAGGKAQRDHLERAFFGPFAYNLVRASDLDFDQVVLPEEAYIGYLGGKWNMKSPEMMAYLKCFKELASGFQDGWMGGGSDPTFLFLHEMSVMLLTGSWAANGIQRLAEGKFEVGVLDVPMPTEHPEYGNYVHGYISEADIKGGIRMGINKSSKHKDICIDFLKYCTSRANNQKFCSEVNWLPVVIGARPRDFLIPFLPRVNGYKSTFDWFSVSTAVSMFRTGKEWSYMANRISADEFAGQMKDVYEKTAEQGFRNICEKNRMIERDALRIATGEIARSVFSSENERRGLNTKIAERIFNQQEKSYYREVQMDMFKSRSSKVCK
jgi:ABC-type glycerol-3-phosphate transport system substrate-binding protein